MKQARLFIALIVTLSIVTYPIPKAVESFPPRHECFEDQAFSARLIWSWQSRALPVRRFASRFWESWKNVAVVRLQGIPDNWKVERQIRWEEGLTLGRVIADNEQLREHITWNVRDIAEMKELGTWDVEDYDEAWEYAVTPNILFERNGIKIRGDRNIKELKLNPEDSIRLIFGEDHFYEPPLEIFSASRLGGQWPLLVPIYRWVESHPTLRLWPRVQLILGNVVFPAACQSGLIVGGLDYLLRQALDLDPNQFSFKHFLVSAALVIAHHAIYAWIPGRGWRWKEMRRKDRLEIFAMTLFYLAMDVRLLSDFAVVPNGYVYHWLTNFIFPHALINARELDEAS